MESESFYLYMSIIATIGLLVNVVSSISSYTNAFKIQMPWFKDYLNKEQQKGNK